DPAFLLLRGVVDRLEAPHLGVAFLGQHGGDGSRQRRLAVIDVTDGPDVDVRLIALELLLRHFWFAPVSTCMSAFDGEVREIYLTAVVTAARCRVGLDGEIGRASGTERV